MPILALQSLEINLVILGPEVGGFGVASWILVVERAKEVIVKKELVDEFTDINPKNPTLTTRQAKEVIIK